MEKNLTNKEKNVGGMYTLDVNDPDKLYFASDT